MKADRFQWGEVFLLLDCGGGTTDVGVYAIRHEIPFRLGKEVVQAKGMPSVSLHHFPVMSKIN